MNFYADEDFLFQRIIRPAAPRAGMPGRYVKSGALSRNKKKFYRVNCKKRKNCQRIYIGFSIDLKSVHFLRTSDLTVDSDPETLAKLI